MSDPFTADYRIRVKFLSDWHIGSGLERPGSVDRLVQRDVEGFPFVPGKTLTGMFRDAAEEVALRLDGDDPSRSWYRWVLWLFGDQPTRRDKEDRAETLGWRYLHKAQVSIRPAELPSELRDALVGDDPRRRELRDALFVHKPGVKINRQGQAENKHLRLDEMVRGGITLVAPLSVSLDGLQPEQRETARNLVLLAAAFIERVGGKRRRGAGRVEVTISGNDVPSPEAVAARLADFLEPHERPAPLPEETDAQPAPPPNEPRQTAAADTGQPSAETAGDEWGILPFRLTLLTPLLVPERTIGNVVKSLDFVPGTYLLPIVTRAFQPHLPDVRERIVAGDIRVSPATIVIDGRRGLPVPAALFHAKGDERPFEQKGHVSNRFLEPDKSEDHIKDFREGYVLADPSGEKLPSYRQPRRVVRPHNTVEEDSQRPTTEVGGVFSYEAIAAGTVLAGEIRIRGRVNRQLNQSMTEICMRLIGEHNLGRSKKDDYGRVRLILIDEKGALVDKKGKTVDWQPLETTKVEQGVEELTVWFTSDVLLVDERLQAATSAKELAAEIATSLGMKAEDLAGEPSAFLRYRRIESWHVGWGLPRPSLVSVAAGSCLKLKFNKPVSAEAVKKLEAEGIGRRKAEGYGMLLVQSRLLTSQLAKWEGADSKPAHPKGEPPKLSADSDELKDLARTLETECWRRRIRKEALERTARADDRLLGFDPPKPNAAQAALLRNLLRLNLSDEELGDRLDRLQKMREKLWPKGCLDRIRKLFSDKQNVWKTLGADTWPVLTEGGREPLKEKLRPEAIKALIDAAVRAHQRYRERQRSKEPANRKAEARN